MMGFLDDMFSKKKETVRTRTAKVAAFKRDPEKKQVASNNNFRAPTPQSNASIFGSLRRGQGGVATSTSKSTPAATKLNEAGKTKVPVQLRNRPPEKEKRPWFRSSNNNILKKEPIKSSTASLNVNSVQKSANTTDLKKKKPAAASNITLRRGQNAKIDGQNLPDNLSRTSSITNLDVEQKIHKGAKPRKSASRDRIDKIGENKKHDKKGVTKNNNKLESGDSPYPSIDSLQEEEFVQLRRQLQEMAQEKSNLALQLGEQKGQLNILQSEIQKLKCFQDESNAQLEHLTEENTLLRNRLRNVAHSPLSDNEKQQLLFETHRHHSSSAPASIATNLIEEGNGGDNTACPTPDWDKHSSSNVSEVSVACLQDKINQMQETHYSTNEELQATLQELTDLQRQLTELQQENERLNEEKTLMFDSLCRQTERLNDSRSEVESLKQLLYREKDETGQYESAVEREQKLVDLLKSAQEEREALLVKLELINNEVQEARAGIVEKDERILQLSNRVRTLESTLDAKHAEHKLMDQELAQAKDQCSGKQIEINRLTDLLDNARTKIGELEQDRDLGDKSELDELLDNARKEKDALESEVAHLKEQLAISKNETEKLREQVSVLQEECKVTRNNARTKQSDLEYKCEKLLLEKNELNDQLQQFQEAVNELQVQSQCQLEDKRQLSAVLSETQRNLSEAERKNLNLESELEELKKLRAEENDEWEKFQNDLLTSVRVANDFKTEAQQELQRMIMENKTYRERERQLKAELDKLKGDKTKKGDLSTTNSSNKSKSSENEKGSNAEMDSVLKLSRRSKERPRKSKESTETSSSGSKFDKTKEKKPELLKKFVKKRERQPAPTRKNKTLSVEEEILLKSLNDWYENIDKNVPEESLTEEERVVKKLKTLYEDDNLKEKPVAHKPKNQLAISKPLLDSVFSNPKLEEIVNDPNVPTIENMEHSEILSCETEAPELRNLPDKTDRQAKGKSEHLDKSGEIKRTSIIGRSKSLDDLYNLDEARASPILYRSTETEDLRNEIHLHSQIDRESSILPSDSVSNPRYSDFAVVVNQQRGLKKNPRSAKVTRKSSVNFETLESIVFSIPKNASEDQLTSEQKFALRLKKSLDEAERKNTLKKLKRTENIIISYPTVDSVNRNPRLKDILLDPRIKSVRRNSEIQVDNIAPLAEETLRQSKSCEDIAFTFDIESNKRTIDKDHSGSVIRKDNSSFKRRETSSTGSFLSSEFNVETDLIGPYDSRVLKKSKGNKLISLYNLREDANSKAMVEKEHDSLLYNETLEKKRDLKIDRDENRAFYFMDEELIVNKIPEILIEDIDGNTNNLNVPEDQDFDLLYNETLNKKLESPTKHKVVKISENKDPDGEDSRDIHRKVMDLSSRVDDDDLEYFETLNENVASPEQEIIKDKDFDNKKSKCYQPISETILYTNVDNQHCDLVYKNKSIEIVEPFKIEEMDNNQRNLDNEKSGYVDYSKIDDVLEASINADEDEKNICGNIELYAKDIPETDEIHNKVFKGYKEIYSKYAVAEVEEEYDYHSILKENRYGVTSPLNIRLTYKDVVKEIKRKFPENQEDNIKEDAYDDSGKSDTFFDDYFGVKHKPKETTSISTQYATDNTSDIDREMEEIFEKYLHTPLSKIITQIEEIKEDKVKIDRNEVQLGNNTIDESLISECNSANKDSTLANSESDVMKDNIDTSGHSLEEIILIIDDKQADLQEKLETTEGASMDTDQYINEPEKHNQEVKEHSEECSKEGTSSGTCKDINELLIDDKSIKGHSEIILSADDSPKALKQTNLKIGTNEENIEDAKIVKEHSVVIIMGDDQKYLKHNVETSSIDDIHQMKNVKMEDVNLNVPKIYENDQLVPDTISSCDLDEEVVITEKIGESKHVPDIIESVNKYVTNKVDKDMAASQVTVKKKIETNLTSEELDLVRSVRIDRFSRPLSDFNEEDLQRIQEISANYAPEELNLQEQDECEEKYIKNPMNEIVLTTIVSGGENENKTDYDLKIPDKDQSQKDIKDIEVTEDKNISDLSVVVNKLVDPMHEVEAFDDKNVLKQSKVDRHIEEQAIEEIQTYGSLQLDQENQKKNKEEQISINHKDENEVNVIVLNEVKQENIRQMKPNEDDSDSDDPKDILIKNEESGLADLKNQDSENFQKWGGLIEKTKEDEIKIDKELSLDNTNANSSNRECHLTDNDFASINQDNIDATNDNKNVGEYSLEEIVLIIDDNQSGLKQGVMESENDSDLNVDLATMVVTREVLLRNDEFIDDKLDTNKNIMQERDDVQLCDKSDIKHVEEQNIIVDDLSVTTDELPVASNKIIQQSEENTGDSENIDDSDVLLIKNVAPEYVSNKSNESVKDEEIVHIMKQNEQNIIDDLNALLPRTIATKCTSNKSNESIKDEEIADIKNQNEENMQEHLEENKTKNRDEPIMFVELDKEGDRYQFSNDGILSIGSHELNDEEKDNERKHKNEDDHDLDLLLARMTAPRDSSVRENKTYDRIKLSNSPIIYKEDKSNTKGSWRKTNYEGVKSKLEYFSKGNEESPSKRQSFTPYLEKVVSERRKVKSWAEQFEKRSLDTHTSYEPVYANFKMISSTKNQPLVSSKIEKKPLPVPRSKNQNSQLSVEYLDRAEPVVKDDKCLKETKMSDIKNFSESKSETIPQEIPSSEFNSAAKFETPIVAGHYESPKSPKLEGNTKLVEEEGKDKRKLAGDTKQNEEEDDKKNELEGSTNQVEEAHKKKKKLLGIKKSEKFLGKMHMPSEENIKIKKDDRQNFASGADYSFSSIAVAGKSEQLDITKVTEEDEMEEIDNNNESTLNLFHLETPSYDESYLSLFKSPEDRMYEDISGQRKSQRGYFNIAYLGEVSDNESLEDLSRHGIDITKNLKENESKPKIIDFVPLDDATEPVFNKNNLNIPDYNTLEREKTYHVLNTAASSAKVRKSVSRIEEAKESKLSLPSVPSGSRTSFSAAKKVFEALLQANLEKPVEKPKLKNKALLRDKPEKVEPRPSISSVETVEREKIIKKDN